MAKKKERTQLHLAQSVDAASDEATSFVPRDGAIVTMENFKGSFTSNKIGTVCLIWDYDSASEVVIDLSNSAAKLLIGTGDGVKKIAVVLSNGEPVDAIAMSGTAVIGELIDA